MSEIFVPAKGPEDWADVMAKPSHWKTGYSAKALAYCWHDADDDDFPKCVRNVFVKCGIPLFREIEFIMAFPEWKVPLHGRGPASQNDIFALANGNGQLVSIMVEGKVSEGFGDNVSQWRSKGSKNREKRLQFLLQKLSLKDEALHTVPYQLLHRTASAIIEAERFGAKNALMLVHSFSEENESIEQYQEFVALFDAEGKAGSLEFAEKINGIDLYFAWVKGDPKYLEE